MQPALVTRSNGARITTRGPSMLLTGGALSAPRTMPLLPAAQDTRPVHTVAKMASTAGEKKGGIDIALIAYFALWYLGNYYYNISNKMALKAAGGAAGFPLTIATLQLGVGVIYALFLWAAPDARSLPTTTKDDVLACIPVAFCSAAAHSFSVFALSAGAVSFGQIVKAAEPAFAALLGVTLYKKKVGLFVHWIQTLQRSILTPHARISRLRAAASSPSRFLPLFPCLSSLTATPIISPPRSPLFPALSGSFPPPGSVRNRGQVLCSCGRPCSLLCHTHSHLPLRCSAHSHAMLCTGFQGKVALSYSCHRRYVLETPRCPRILRRRSRFIARRGGRR